MQSIPPTTNVVSSNPAHGEVYSIEHYLIKCVSDLRKDGGFFRILQLHPSLKLTATIIYNRNIVENGAKQHNSNPDLSRHRTFMIIENLDYMLFWYL